MHLDILSMLFSASLVGLCSDTLNLDGHASNPHYKQNLSIYTNMHEPIHSPYTLIMYITLPHLLYKV